MLQGKVSTSLQCLISWDPEDSKNDLTVQEKHKNPWNPFKKIKTTNLHCKWKNTICHLFNVYTEPTVASSKWFQMVFQISQKKPKRPRSSKLKIETV